MDTADPDWAAQLRTVAHAFRHLALSHPNVFPLLVTRPLTTPLGQRPPGMLRPLEDVLALLTSAGFAGDDALHIYRLLFGYLYGHMLNELQEVNERPEETDHVLRLGLHRLPITEFPQLRALAPALASYDGAAELDRFLDLLLPGLATTLHPDEYPEASEVDGGPPPLNHMHRGETSAHREVAAPLIMSLSTNVSGMINPRSWSSSASVHRALAGRRLPGEYPCGAALSG